MRRHPEKWGYLTLIYPALNVLFAKRSLGFGIAIPSEVLSIDDLLLRLRHINVSQPWGFRPSGDFTLRLKPKLRLANT